MWKLYDELIGRIPPDILADGITIGLDWTVVTAVIGHFHKLENYLKEAASVAVLERRPAGDDYPDSACEYILPEQDFVFITGTTLINKTLPRLLELAKDAHVVLVGPSTPMTPILFDYGVNELSGFLVCDKDGLIDAVTTAGHDTFFRCGERTRMIRKRP